MDRWRLAFPSVVRLENFGLIHGRCRDKSQFLFLATFFGQFGVSTSLQNVTQLAWAGTPNSGVKWCTMVANETVNLYSHSFGIGGLV